MNPLNLTGEKYGRLQVINLLPNTERRVWLCICDCGAYVEAKQERLRAGDKKSCGCLKSDILTYRNTTHGMTHSYTYKKWQSMKNRVSHPYKDKNKCYAGIDISPEWDTFEGFYSDMGECPKGYSLDRIDNAKGYNKTNCRWVPLLDQASNTRRNIYINFGGVTKHISAHCRGVGISPDAVWDRVHKLGWSYDKALVTPLQVQKKHRVKEGL